jgi:hypothetical protein
MAEVTSVRFWPTQTLLDYIIACNEKGIKIPAEVILEIDHRLTFADDNGVRES